MNGILVLDKPAGISSAAAVNRVKRLLPRGTKIGHAGTLDPFATGVLLLLVGGATRSCEKLMDARKTYEATVKLGATTETDDPEMQEKPFAGGAHAVGLVEVRSALLKFVGAIMQRPPLYSALKIDGRRACDRVRDGQDIELKPRAVNVHSIEVLDLSYPFLKLRIECGRGTYIRSIARDLGAELRVGGYLTALRRTRIGAYGLENALSLDSLDLDQLRHHLIPISP